MKLKYRLFRRQNGIYFCENRTTHQQQSLRTKNRAEAARLINAKNEAQENDDFMAVFRKAAARDLSKDSQSNSYLPILMGAAGPKELPQRAQWSFCHAVYPGQIFPPDDSLVAGNMAMLEATEREGMVYGTG